MTCWNVRSIVIHKIASHQQNDTYTAADELYISPLESFLERYRQALSDDHTRSDRYLMQSAKKTTEPLWGDFR
jgi:hypothetical protein